MRPTTTVAMISIFILMFFSIPHSVLTSSSFTKLQLPLNVIGPDSLAFDQQGRGPYTGVSDGRVLKYEGPTSGFTSFVHTIHYTNLVCFQDENVWFPRKLLSQLNHNKLVNVLFVGYEVQVQGSM